MSIYPISTFDHILGDLELHIASRNATKSSLTKAVVDLLNPLYNAQLFIEDGNTVTIIFENYGVEETQRKQHDLIHAIINSISQKLWLKFYLLRSSALSGSTEFHKSSLNIFLVDGFESFLTIYEKVIEPNFEFDAFYLVILNYLEEDWFIVAKRIFAKSWKRYMINTTLMFMSNTMDEVKIFTYFPFTDKKCETTDPVLIQRILNGKWENDETVFPNKLENFNKCLLKVALFDVVPFVFLNEYKKKNGSKSVMNNLDGIDANLLKTLAKKFNFTIDPVVVDEWGFAIPFNRSNNGAIEAILTKRANMTLGFFAISASRNSKLKPGFPYHTSTIIFVIPPEIKEISRLIRPLSSTLQVVILVTFGFGAGIVFIASKTKWRILILGRNNQHPFCNMILSALGGSLANVPLNNFARFCLISWILLCFVINNFYLAKYFQLLTQEDQISLANTFTKITDRQYTVYIRPICNEFFDDHPKLKALSQVLSLSEYPDMEKRMQDSSTSAVLLHTLDFVLYKNKAIYRNKPLLVASQHVIDQQITIYYPNDSCLRHAFNHFLRDMTSNGLISYWVKQYIDPMYQMKEPKTGRNEEDLVLTNIHLSDVYCAAMVGWFLSILVFLGEIAVSRMNLGRSK